MNNPYTPPASNVTSNSQMMRAKAPKVLGIIIIILSILGLIGVTIGLVTMYAMPGVMEAQLQLGYSKDYLVGSNVVSVIVTVWLLIIGIWLIKYKDKGRRHFNYYAIFTVIMSIFNFFYIGTLIENVNEATMQTLLIARYSVFFSVALVLLVVYFLNRETSKASLTN